MLEILKQFWKDENGAHIAEYIAWLVVIGLGSITVLYGISAAQRGLAGETINQIKTINP